MDLPDRQDEDVVFARTGIRSRYSFRVAASMAAEAAARRFPRTIHSSS